MPNSAQSSTPHNLQSDRIAPLRENLKVSSILLLGPRQTGKSTLIRQALGDDCVCYDVLDTKVFSEISQRPWLIRKRLTPDQKLIVIDEVQKIPSLLDEVHLMIVRDPELRFLLSGSSARKLNRGAANLTGGRLWDAQMHPFVSAELDYAHWSERVRIGSIPGIVGSADPVRALQAYAGLYLREDFGTREKRPVCARQK